MKTFIIIYDKEVAITWWWAKTRFLAIAGAILLICLLASSIANARPFGISSKDSASYIESTTGVEPAGWITQGTVEALYLVSGIKPPESDKPSLPIYNEAPFSDQEVIPVFLANQILALIQNNKSVKLDHAVIKGDLNLGQLKLPKKRVEGSNLSIVAVPISITQSLILGNVIFNDTLFVRSVDFSWSKVLNISDFDNSRFNDGSDFNITDFIGNAHFSKTVFNNTAGFVLSSFRKYAIFMDCTFNGTANFVSSNFSSISDFSGSNFRRNANFVDANFYNDSYFSRCRFDKDAIFGLTKEMEEWTYVFNPATDVSYYWYDITGMRVVAHIPVNDNINHIYGFRGTTDFSNSAFERYADFSKRQFNGDAYFNGATFRNIADFNNVQFDGYANFFNAKILGIFNFTKIKLGNPGIYWPDASFFVSDDGPTYLYLIKYFRDSEQYSVADEIYFRYRAWRQDQRSWSDWYKCVDLFALHTCGYGVRVDYTLRLAVIMIVAFGLLYSIISRVKNLSQENFLGKLNESLWFSLVILLSAPKELYPLGHGTYDNYTKNIKYLPILERLIGWGLLLLLINTLSRVMIRY